MQKRERFDKTFNCTKPVKINRAFEISIDKRVKSNFKKALVTVTEHFLSGSAGEILLFGY